MFAATPQRFACVRRLVRLGIVPLIGAEPANLLLDADNGPGLIGVTVFRDGKRVSKHSQFLIRLENFANRT